MTKSILLLIRWPNLLLLGLVQFLIWHHLGTERASFVALILGMTLSATAAGYVVNDLFDMLPDRINGRMNAFVSGAMSPGLGRNLYVVFMLIGFVCSVGLGLVWSWHFAWIYGAISLLLWIYAFQLKGMFLIGNATVSVLCAAAIFLIWWPVHEASTAPDVLWQLAAFAGVVTWLRELIKDMEDLKGDQLAGHRTFPVVAGVTASRIFAVFLTGIVCASLIMIFVGSPDLKPVSVIFWFLTILPLIVTGGMLLRRHYTASYFHRISTMVKITMLTGALFFTL